MFIQKQIKDDTKELEVAFEDDNIRVEVGVNQNNELPNIGYSDYYPNAIKITANSANAHFIQFVTRQVPDLFNLNWGDKTLKWNVPDETKYMQDSINPNWKLDVYEHTQTCFYDQQGPAIVRRTDATVSIYDSPGIPKKERAAFCTFVIMNNRVTHLVKWSKQCNKEDADFHTVEVQPRNQEKLPAWVSHKLLQYYRDKHVNLPNELLQNMNRGSFESITSSDLAKQEQPYLLAPPTNWITKLDYPALFSPQFPRRYSFNL